MNTNICSSRYPIFSLAFGTGADFDFLRKLSLSNAGFARNIYVASDTTLQLKNFYKEVASPLLSNVSFEYVPGQVSRQSFVHVGNSFLPLIWLHQLGVLNFIFFKDTFTRYLEKLSKTFFFTSFLHVIVVLLVLL